MGIVSAGDGEGLSSACDSVLAGADVCAKLGA
jgi:hypothetical protein